MNKRGGWEDKAAARAIQRRALGSAPVEAVSPSADSLSDLKHRERLGCTEDVGFHKISPHRTPTQFRHRTR